MLKMSQVCATTSDLPGTLQLWSDLFGFVNAGAQSLWGSTIRVQGLDKSDRGIVWWLVGQQPFVQLEFFYHTKPAQRPLPDDWSPRDLGWVRCGITVAAFDRALTLLNERGIALLGAVTERHGLRRAAFREPYIGMIIELLEDGDALPWREYPAPALVYTTSSVSDLDGARAFYSEMLGLPIEPLESLHVPEDEALWGLGTAKREGFLARAADFSIEVVRYDPPGRPRRADYRVSDQGMVNVAFSSHNTSEIAELFDRLRVEGFIPPYLIRAEGFCGGYINDPERELKFLSLEGAAADAGFKPAQPFITEL